MRFRQSWNVRRRVLCVSNQEIQRTGVWRVIEGRLRWSSGDPALLAVTAARLDVESSSDLSLPPAPVSGATAGTDGRFFLRELPPGSYEVALAAGLGFARSERVELSPAHPTALIDWTLPDGFTVEGRVLNPEGEPVEHAYVNLSRPELEKQKAVYVRTDAEGTFRFEHFQGSRYRLYVSCHEGAVKVAAKSAELLSRTITGEISDSGQIEVALRAARTKISGQVLADNGQPAALAYVCRDDGRGIQSDGVLTDAAGRFTIRVDGDATTHLSAWATEPFSASTERQNLGRVSYDLQREVLNQFGEPLARGLYPPDPQASVASGARIVLD